MHRQLGSRASDAPHRDRKTELDVRRIQRGGERAAAIYSLIETAKLHGLDPETYLRYVLEHIADYPVSRVGDLLPWNTTGLQSRLDQRIAA
jgi:hypothetical protein